MHKYRGNEQTIAIYNTAKGKRRLLEINVRQENKLVEIWLTRAETADQTVRERLTPLYQEYSKKKYLVAVFQSGTLDLCRETGALLCYNRKRTAERERCQEQQGGRHMVP